MSDTPCVIAAAYCGGHRIRVTFEDGIQKIIDFRPWLKGPVFEPLRDEKYFQRFFLDGWTIAWPNGADIAPETLYASAAQPGTRLNERPRPIRVAVSATQPRVARG